MTTSVEFACDDAAGRSGLFSVAAAGWCWWLRSSRPQTAPINGRRSRDRRGRAGRRMISGHFSASLPGGMAIAIHALAAALWCGALAALVLTVDHRGQWARVLPRFSELSLWCVIAC